MTHKIDWDEAYRAEEGPAWNIGAPQPEYAALIDTAGAVDGEVLAPGAGTPSWRWPWPSGATPWWAST